MIMVKDRRRDVVVGCCLRWSSRNVFYVSLVCAENFILIPTYILTSRTYPTAIPLHFHLPYHTMGTSF